MYNAFSQSLMKKYGWNEGDGLGKNNQGITQPIKATLKFNSHGLAYKEIDTEQDSKWSNMFSSAVSNLKVENDNQITVTKNDTKEEKLNLSGVNVLYKSFSKSTALLKDGVEVKEKKPKKSKRKLENLEITNDSNVKKSKIANESDLSNGIISPIISNIEKIKKKKKSKIDGIINSENQTKIDKNSRKSKNRNENNQNRKNKTKSDQNESEPQESKNRDKTKEKGIYNEIPTKIRKNKKKKSEKTIENDLTKKQSIIVPDSTFLTCHTSARCGITMSGKLARIQKLHEEEKLKNQIKSLV